MARLLDLPNEILLIICSFLNHMVLKDELQALCLTSKLLYSIAQPFLYTRFEQEARCQCCNSRGILPGHLVAMVRLVRTLIERPDLAARVQSATIDTSGNDGDDDHVRKADFDADTLKTLAAGFQQLPTDKAQLFMETVEMRSNPYLLLLASRMSNLEHLELVLGDEGLDDLAPLFTPCSEDVMIEQPYLRNLKSVVIRDMMLTECDSMMNLDAVMELPQLENFTLIGLNGDAEGCPLFDFEPGTLNISTLTLAAACLDAETLTQIVAGCKELKVFKYFGSNFDGNTMNESIQFDPSELVSILASQQENIVTLFCNLDWEVIDPTNWSRCSKYGSFASFTKLMHLEIDQYPYTPKQELPPSIHCLHIKNISFPIIDVVGSLNMRTIDLPEHELHDELPNFSILTLVPRDDIPNGMLDVPARYDHTDEDLKTMGEFDFACETLWDIAKECRFSVRVEHDVWARFHGYF
ncbi:uncharacterized protein DSM5745_09713 [Aspergillus mulundensis]|uniref:F-box domain-containing protein n=1 Tax=Aspergillus mulundensis TaxID=1810919 RepID=A0A3D8QR77_9EURO|nr:Uncharacterized protein DSM5745_09713 [Aspergillus mulundensis]RDW64302.1 Uncharacterized protein DSM5745_09713 [Aspergillus mulundensis]